jgi:hypothetical protein
MFRRLTFLLAMLTSLAGPGKGQESRSDLPVQINYIALRPARWEEKALIEEINEKRNQGGLVFVYYTNTSDKPVSLREWYLNARESGHFRLAGDVAWDRRYADVLAPGQTAVQEICGVSDDFQPGKPADFAIIGGDWQPVAFKAGFFEQEKLRVTSIVMDSSLSGICIHIKNFTPHEAAIQTLSFEGKTVASTSFTSQKIEGRGHIIASVKLDRAFTPGELALLKIEAQINGRSEVIYSHRNAYADYFPNGTWGIEETQYADARTHHLNTMVRGGKSSDRFFSQDYRSTGIKAMPHTGIYPDIDQIRDLENHPAVACWYLHDEPDWLYHPLLMLASNQMTKKYSLKKPTLITLCRNVKFFEFAFLADVPCHDHYSVTAPTTSKWPYPYGTRLEETGYYTADLKYASEPKPIWVWSQGVHLWDERPRMPLPTPDELGAQLYFNLGRGAKGILWFTFLEEAGRRYPATKQALREYSRVVRLLEEDLLLSDPWPGGFSAPEGVDVAPLISPDKLVVFISNLDYAISDSAYQWNPVRRLHLELAVPNWFSAVDGFEIDPSEGIKPVKWALKGKTIAIDIEALKMGRVLVFTARRDSRKQLEAGFARLLKLEE